MPHDLMNHFQFFELKNGSHKKVSSMPNPGIKLTHKRSPVDTIAPDTIAGIYDRGSTK